MIALNEIDMPKAEGDITPIVLSDETMKQRKENVLSKMKDAHIDALVIYADLEHGANFEYLTGFLPRFEEALLILHKDGSAYMVLGNENLNKASKSRIEVTPIHLPHFSLPNQPMDTTLTITEILKKANLAQADCIGLVGWKLFTSKIDEPSLYSDIPHYIVKALYEITHSTFCNATSLFIGANGVRTINNANEFAHYEFGAALAGNCILHAMEKIKEGITEMEVANELDAYGQPHSVVTIMASGERFEKANMYPAMKNIQKGDRIAITTGFKGGLQSRCGYAVEDRSQLPSTEQDYLDRIAIPYFHAVKCWLETIHIGMPGLKLYTLMEEVLPREIYGWSLNPGHLCADEEWLASPIYPTSKEILKSGMLLQIDIIPSVPGYAGISCESGIFLADEQLRAQIKEEYPKLWNRIEKRCHFMKDVLGINISDDVIPTSIATAVCKPFLLHKNKVFVNV